MEIKRVWLLLLTASLPLSPLEARSKRSISTPPSSLSFTKKELLKNSQISYRAEGGFTGVRSYGVILSCVDGKISVLKNIYDPRLGRDRSRLRQMATMETEDYVALWNDLRRHSVFVTQSAPVPATETLDEFTVSFQFQVGESTHQFIAQAISRPEASRHFAIRSLIDSRVNMPALWSTYSQVARQ